MLVGITLANLFKQMKGPFGILQKSLKDFGKLHKIIREKREKERLDDNSRLYL